MFLYYMVYYSAYACNKECNPDIVYPVQECYLCNRRLLRDQIIKKCKRVRGMNGATQFCIDPDIVLLGIPVLTP